MMRVAALVVVCALCASCVPRGLAATLDKLRAACADTHIAGAAVEVEACGEAYLLECEADDTADHTLTCEIR